jgi:hypothetical protein
MIKKLLTQNNMSNKKPSKKHSFKSHLYEQTVYTLTQNQKTLLNKHKQVLVIHKEHTGVSNRQVFRPYKLNVTTEIINHSSSDSPTEESIAVPELLPDKISRDIVKMTPEGFAFLFTLEGCAKNLLLFLMLMKVQRVRGAKDVNQFPLNKLVVDQFNDFCIQILGEPYKINTIERAITELKHKNAIISQTKGVYYLNPLILARASEIEKNSALHQYSSMLMMKGKDSILDFYPKYHL